MSSGKVHASAGWAVAIAAAAVYGATYERSAALLSSPATMAVGAGLLIGIAVTPDVDMVLITYEERRIERLFGGLLGRLLRWLWQLYWLPYARLVRHRHPLSHAPILGTLLRAAYLWPLWALAWWSGLPIALAIYVLIGWGVQDALHWAMDTIGRVL